MTFPQNKRRDKKVNEKVGGGGVWMEDYKRTKKKKREFICKLLDELRNELQ